MLDRGWLRMYVLRLNGAVAAVMYGFGYDGRFYFYQHGFDARYQRAQHRPRADGAVRFARRSTKAMQAFDMLWGAEPYKWLWASDARMLHRIHVFPAHFGGWLHQRCRRSATPARRRWPAVSLTLESFSCTRL